MDLDYAVDAEYFAWSGKNSYFLKRLKGLIFLENISSRPPNCKVGGWGYGPKKKAKR